MSKPLIIGEQPSKNGNPEQPLEGRIGHRMAEWMGITYEQYLDFFVRVNLLPQRIEYSGKGTDFNVKLARRSAKQIEETFTPGRIVVICGKRAASAFGIVKTDYFEWFALNHAKAVIVPHPSGVNRWFNDPSNEMKMMAFCRVLVRIVEHN